MTKYHKGQTDRPKTKGDYFGGLLELFILIAECLGKELNDLVISVLKFLLKRISVKQRAIF